VKSAEAKTWRGFSHLLDLKAHQKVMILLLRALHPAKVARAGHAPVVRVVIKILFKKSMRSIKSAI
jgi:hypothetical protein